MKMFYQQNAVQTVLHPDGDTTLLRALDTPLAEHCSGARSQSLVLGCDQQGSPMNVMSANASRTGRYTPYGLETTLPSATGFTGQLKAWSLPGYFLGSGYRFFNTVLMRFHSPDSLSPFAAGGINAYMYCGGDPVNRIDPSGHMFKTSSGAVKRSRSPSRLITPPVSPSYKRSFNYEEASIFHEIERFFPPLSDSLWTSASTFSAGSSGHAVATVNSGNVLTAVGPENVLTSIIISTTIKEGAISNTPPSKDWLASQYAEHRIKAIGTLPDEEATSAWKGAYRARKTGKSAWSYLSKTLKLNRSNTKAVYSSVMFYLRNKENSSV